MPAPPSEVDAGSDAHECPICLEAVGEDDAHRLECSHVFHATCLIGWLRQGHLSCPLCRTDLHAEGPPDPAEIPTLALRARASHMRTVARRASAPAPLRRLVQRLRDAEEQERSLAREVAAIRREHRDVFSSYSRLRSRKWSAWHRVRKLKDLLGLFECDGHRLPRLSVARVGAW